MYYHPNPRPTRQLFECCSFELEAEDCEEVVVTCAALGGGVRLGPHGDVAGSGQDAPPAVLQVLGEAVLGRPLGPVLRLGDAGAVVTGGTPDHQERLSNIVASNKISLKSPYVNP